MRDEKRWWVAPGQSCGLRWDDGWVGGLHMSCTYLLYVGCCAGAANVGAVANTLVGVAAAAGMNQAPQEPSRWQIPIRALINTRLTPFNTMVEFPASAIIEVVAVKHHWCR